MTKEVLRRRRVLAIAWSRHPDPELDDGDVAELSHWLDHLAPELAGWKDPAE